MKRVWLVFFSILVLITLYILMASCRSVLVDEDELEPMPVSTPETVQTMAALPLPFTGHYESSKSFHDDKLKIIINAEVNPTAQTDYFIHSIEESDFDTEVVDAVLQYFCGEATLYQCGPATKDELTTYLLAYEDLLDKDYEHKELLNRHIIDITDAINNAPTKVDPVEADLTADCISAHADLAQPFHAFFNLNRSKGNLSFTNGHGYYHSRCKERLGYQDSVDSPVTYIDEHTTPQTLSEDVAIQLAETFLNEVGIGDYTCSHVETGIKMLAEGIWLEDQLCHFVFFTPDINSIPVAFQRSASFGLDKGNAQYNESICVSVDETGVFGVDWSNHSRITQSCCDTPILRSFDDVISDFFDSTADNYTPSADCIDHTITITDIRLEYVYVSDSGPYDTASLVPVWNFYGHAISRNREDGRIKVKEIDRISLRHAFYSGFAIEYN